MPGRLVESHGTLGEIKNEPRVCGRVPAASARKRGNKLDLYQLLCATDRHPRPDSQLSHFRHSDRPASSCAPARPRDALASASSRSRSENNLPAAARPRSSAKSMQPPPAPVQKPHLVWDWDIEHADRQAERKADAAVHGAIPFEVDRKLLKDIVKERMGADVARIKYLGAGTFHKGYLVTLVDAREVVARVARRFMPRLKTESEVATMRYLREHTDVPVPEVYQYDANPYNRLGGEYILMSKAPGIPLSKVFHSMPHSTMVALLENVSMMILPLFAHRFPMIGSLYDGPDPHTASNITSSLPTPTPSSYTRLTNISDAVSKLESQQDSSKEFHVGPIVSWPFFGSNRGDLSHPDELNRGPWPTTREYLLSCAEREVRGVILENEGKAAPHKLHLDPDEILSSRHHKVTALSDDQSDTSDEWDWEESEAEWDGPGDTMYQDYRRMQRTTFLVAHLKEREQRVQAEMQRFLSMMERLGAVNHDEGDGGGGGGVPEGFTLDCHDLNLENVFVDEDDNSKITCIIDWESTTTRPLWACAHVPAFLQSSPFTAKLFRATVERIARTPRTVTVLGKSVDVAAVATEWLHYESSGTRLRLAHRCIEWDGWEEGLVESILGPEDQEEDWFKTWDEADAGSAPHSPADDGDLHGDADTDDHPAPPPPPDSPLVSGSPTLTTSTSEGEDGLKARKTSGGAAMLAAPKIVVAAEKAREKLLNATGDFCGGRGGELGRRLEAWLYVNGDEDGRVDIGRRWEGDEGEDAAAPQEES